MCSTVGEGGRRCAAAMRFWGSLFSYIGVEKRVRADHPLRAIREIPNAALAALTGEFARARLDPAGAADAGAAAAGLLFDPLGGQLVERIDYDVLMRTRYRTPRHHEEPRPAARGRGGAEVPCRGAGTEQSEALVVAPRGGRIAQAVFSGENSSCSPTPPTTCRRPKKMLARPASAIFAARATQKRDLSTTDPDARLFAKNRGRKRGWSLWHALMENRKAPLVGAVATRASGRAERLAALALIEPRAERPEATLGADKG